MGRGGAPASLPAMFSFNLFCCCRFNRLLRQLTRHSCVPPSLGPRRRQIPPHQYVHERVAVRSLSRRARPAGRPELQASESVGETCKACVRGIFSSARTIHLKKRWRERERKKIVSYAFSVSFCSSSSCHCGRLVASLGSTGRRRGCHGNGGGGLPVGRGGRDVRASVPVT